MGISFGGWLTAEYVLHAPAAVGKAAWLSPAGWFCRCPASSSPAAWYASSRRSVLFGGSPAGSCRTLPSREPEFFEGAVEEMVLSEKCFKFRMWPVAARAS